jgi:5,10-methylenetetrahydromethanopterin reductase
VIPIGVVVPPDLPAGEFITYVKEAERHGFDQLWVVEDCLFRGGVAQAGVALAMTTTITVGLGILPAGPGMLLSPHLRLRPSRTCSRTG